MSQLANCPLTEATLDRIATVENRLTIAPPNPLVRQMILLQSGFLIAFVAGVVCMAIGIGLTFGLRYVSDQAGRLWKQHEFQAEQDKARKAYEAETGKAHPEPLSLQEQFAALEAKHAKEEAAAKQQAEAVRLQEEQQAKASQLEAERLDKLKAEQQRLDAQRAEAARLKQQQSSQADPEMSRSYSSAPEPKLDVVKCRKLIRLAEADAASTETRHGASSPAGMAYEDYGYYLETCLPAAEGGKL
jgi:type IV secretory pathway VirB10-like protein